MTNAKTGGRRKGSVRSANEPKPMPVSEVIRRLSNVMEPLILRPGDRLFVAGEQLDGVYLIHRGKVKLYYSNRDFVVTERHARGGEILGLGALFADRPWVATSEVVSPTRAGFVRRKDVLDFIDESLVGRLAILRLLSLDVDRSYELIRERNFVVSKIA